jgi:hypothetical protein
MGQWLAFSALLNVASSIPPVGAMPNQVRDGTSQLYSNPCTVAARCPTGQNWRTFLSTSKSGGITRRGYLTSSCEDAFDISDHCQLTPLTTGNI